MSRPWSRSARALLAFLLLVLATPPAFGVLAQRTFVSGTPVASDANPCSLALPCRSFGAAIAQTISGGEVIVLDSAGYGPVTITQSVSIIAPAGVYAGISVISPTNFVGVSVNAAGIKVLLQNLVINALGGNYGIFLQQGAELYVNNCTVANFTSAGIYSIAGGSKLYLKDTVVRNSGPGAYGLWLFGTAVADVERVRIESNGNDGVRAEGGASVSIKRSVLARNGGSGLIAFAAAGIVVRATVEDSLVSDNGSDGLTATSSGAGAVAEISAARNTITRNADNGVGTGASSSGSSVANLSDNLLTQQGLDGVAATGAGAVVTASRNTFAGNATSALHTFTGGTIHTVKGADALPNNAGEQTTPTIGNVVPANAF